MVFREVLPAGEKKTIQVYARAGAHCPINAAIRTADSQSNLRIFLQLCFYYTICINRRAMFLVHHRTPHPLQMTP